MLLGMVPADIAARLLLDGYHGGPAGLVSLAAIAALAAVCLRSYGYADGYQQGRSDAAVDLYHARRERERRRHV